MGFFSGLKKITKPLVNAPRWMDLEGAKKFGSVLVDVFQNTFVPKKAKIIETFEQAMARLQLTEADLQARQKEIRRLIIIYTLISCVLLSYVIYHFWSGHIIAGFLALIISTLVFAQIFRCHFWLFQIKHRQLGCTLRQWYRIGLLGKTS